MLHNVSMTTRAISFSAVAEREPTLSEDLHQNLRKIRGEWNQRRPFLRHVLKDPLEKVHAT